MANYTQHYQLHQWEATDNFLRTDFNTDFGKIDGALGSKAELVTGAYIGDGTASRTINLGFQPKAVYLCTRNGLAGMASGTYYIYGGLALTGKPLVMENGHEVAMELTNTGFQLTYAPYRQVNVDGWSYYYVAMR